MANPVRQFFVNEPEAARVVLVDTIGVPYKASGGGGSSDVNIIEIGGNPVTTTIPVSGTVSVTEPVSVDDNGGSLTVDGPLTDTELRATPVPVFGTVSVTEPVTVDATDLDIRNLVFATDKVDASGTVLGAGDNTIGRVKITDGTDVALVTTAGEQNVLATAQPGVDIGDVTVNNGAAAAAVNIQDGGNSITIDQSTPALLNAQVFGSSLVDTPATGNPVLVGLVQETMADSAPTSRVDDDGDISRPAATDGALFVVTTGPQTWSYHEDSSSALTDSTVHASPGSNLSLYVTDIVFSLGAAIAINIFFEEGVTTVLGPWYLEAVNGRGLAIHFGTPKKITAATALTVTTSAAVAHSIDVQGFVARG